MGQNFKEFFFPERRSLLGVLVFLYAVATGGMHEAQAANEEIGRWSSPSVGQQALSGGGFPQAWIGNEPRVRGWNKLAPADRVRLSLKERGIYRVTAAELALATGWDEAAVVAAITATNLSLSCEGAEVAWQSMGDALLFYGEPTTQFYAPESVYWVKFANGVGVTSRPSGVSVEAVTNRFFSYTESFVGTNYLSREGYSSITNCAYITATKMLLAEIPGRPSEASAKIATPLPYSAAGDWQGSVTVRLLSLYEVGTDNHKAQISIGGRVVGTNSWSGERLVEASYPFLSSDLSNGVLNLEIKNIAAFSLLETDYTRFVGHSFDITYNRTYLGEGNGLFCSSGEGEVIVASGFEKNDLLVWDISEPRHPEALAEPQIDWNSESASWQVGFNDAYSNHNYFVASKSEGIRQPAVRGVRNIEWAQVNSARYVILIPPEAWREDFRGAVQPLADYRNRLGMSTTIIDIEEIYNAFSEGLVTPWAIQRFCQAAYPKGLRYLLLAGCGTPDFKHSTFSINDYTACLIPSLFVGQRFWSGEGMCIPIDAYLGDIDGDGAPEVAIGRLSTTRTSEITTVIAKTMAYEAEQLWRLPVSLLADWNNTGVKYYDFSGCSDNFANWLEAARRPYLKHYITENSTANYTAIRDNSLIPALARGASIFHSFGHTKESALGTGDNSRRFGYIHITPDNWQSPTVAIFMGCRVNRWQSLTTTVRIIPYGVYLAGGGFAAGIGPTGNISGETSEYFSLTFFKTMANRPTVKRLGDLYLESLRANRRYHPLEELMCISLVGDPTLQIAAGNATLIEIK